MCVSQVVQYSSVSYTAPQMLPVTPPQPYSTVCTAGHVFAVSSYVCLCVCAHALFFDRQIEDLSSQFAHVTVSCQSAGEAPPVYPSSQGYIYAAAAPPPPPPPSNPPSYCQPSTQVGPRTLCYSSCIQVCTTIILGYIYKIMCL